MLDRLLDTIAPHICCSCGVENGLLCQYCQYDIVSERFECCVVCLKPTANSSLCSSCHKTVRYDDGWVVGWRRDSLRQLIDLYKFERAVAASDILAVLLHHTLPQFPTETIVTYIPTISSHRRQRGYDHMKCVAEKFAQRRRLQSSDLLDRRTSLPQRGSTKKDRLTRQSGAFEVRSEVGSPVLILDDIYTTGGTITAGVQALRSVSSQPIFVGIIARQPID